MQNPYNMSMPDIPPALASILNVGSAGTPAMGTPPVAGLSGGMGGSATFAPSYQAGGMIGPGGAPDMSGAGMPSMPGAGMSAGTGVGVNEQAVGQGGTMSPQMLEMQVNQFATQNPQQVEAIRVAIQQVMQTGELTQQELNMIVQLATVAAQNPEMYPYVRKFAIQNGIATEQDLPPQYDQGLVFILLLAARAIQADTGGQNMMQGGSPAMAGGPEISASQVSSGAVPSMARGGEVQQSKKMDGSVLINAHEGEYVIPANVVKMKGKEFFDSLVEKYK